jgi:hypothetical protein
MRKDYSRTAAAKARTVTRRNDRRTASALRLMILLDTRQPFGGF